VIHEERPGKLYTFKYWEGFPIAIATTRPETKIGDVAVAVHPDDSRYTEYIGQTFIGKFVGYDLSIKVIADNSIDPEFGTGAVGITPAHSQIDNEISIRHDLYYDSKQVIDEFARIMEGPLKGKKTLEAREVIISNLKEKNLLLKEEGTTINISLAERSGGVIEPLPKLQWFINVNQEFVIEHSKIAGITSGTKTTLKQIMRSAVLNGQVKIIPDNFEKVYFNWIDNLRDWCISRQIWYGHQIPVWYRSNEVWVDLKAPEGDGWIQDEDTLDTWFSSGLWTFSTLGWPDQTEDLKDYHPTTFMAPGYEILFFWVARMILFSGVLLGEIPFKTVYLHGMVRDKNGNKFSKSAGNGVDPIDVINEYGSDAMRMALIVGVGPGSDSKFDLNKVKAYKHFANKIWNASRYVLEHTTEVPRGTLDTLMSDEDQKILGEFGDLVKDVTKDMEDCRFYLAAEKIYHYFWHTFADVIIEKKKKEEDKRILKILLEEQLKILHPFMPFITEKIWSMLPEKTGILMVEPWPIIKN